MNQNQKWVIFSQNEIISLYGNNLRESLKSAGFQVELVVLPDGHFLSKWGRTDFEEER